MFGSAFSQCENARDIDLLLIHQNISESSCQMAIICKSRLSRMISNAHITILSQSEESQLGFISTAGAIEAGQVRSEHFTPDLDKLVSKIGRLLTKK